MDGDRREDAAILAGTTVATVWVSAELAIIGAVAAAVEKSLPVAAVTITALRRLQRQVAMILAAAEQRARTIVERAGVPWDYRPVLPELPSTTPAADPADTIPLPVIEPIEPAQPAGQLPAAGRPAIEPPQDAPADLPLQPPSAPPAAVADEPADGMPAVIPATPADADPEPVPVTATTAPSIQDTIEAVSVRVYRDIPDIYQTAVEQAITSTRGGQPGISLSLSRIQAAQKALDSLAEHGITGFTDSAGRNWDLVSYIEMATRTAVSNAYDNLQNAALIRGGHDLIFTFTHSTEGSCPLCLPWLGKVLSLTGATTGPVQITDAAGIKVRLDVAGTLGEARAAGFRHPSCRCSWILWVDGADMAAATAFAEPIGDAEETYRASQVQRALERRVRRAARRHEAAVTPQARGRARRDLDAARKASAAHREATGLRMTKAGWRRREHPWNAR